MDVSALRQGFAGQLVVDGDEDFDSLRSVFNGMIDRRPAVIARAGSADDVRAAVNFAREQSLPLSVYGGGHAVTGHAVCDDGVCIDLRLMNRVTVDPEARTGRVQGGALWRDVDAATQEHGLAVTGGRMSDTGVGGLALGSGSGWLEGKVRPTLDNPRSGGIGTPGGPLPTPPPARDPGPVW